MIQPCRHLDSENPVPCGCGGECPCKPGCRIACAIAASTAVRKLPDWKFAGLGPPPRRAPVRNYVEELVRTCLACGYALIDRKCKLICTRCGYFASCNDML